MKIAGHDDLLCQCGAHGCLAAAASGRAVARALSELGKPASSASDVGTYLADGDPDAARLTQAAGRVIGEVVATVGKLVRVDFRGTGQLGVHEETLETQYVLPIPEDRVGLL